MIILLIEDDKEMADSLAGSLGSHGFAVDVAYDGEAGLHKAKRGEYDIVILDKGLPKKDGLSVCECIRSAGRHMPILVLSAHSETDQKAGLLNAGADDYLTKPFEVVELIARIHALLRRPKNIAPTKLHIGDLCIHLEGRTVTRRDEEIHLTAKEFSLLEYLLRNRGRAISRREILEHVWDMNADLFTNTVETHIMTLRKKVENKKGAKVIHTLSGIGYKII